MAIAFDCPPIDALDDDQLVERYRAGDLSALDVLLNRYRRFARAKSRTYFLVGADVDDIEQEGMIGLFKAVRDFRTEQSSFRAFAELCITRQVITAIKGATRQKHQPLNRYVSISGPRPGDDDERGVDELLASHVARDPADEVISQDRLSRMRAVLRDTLSDLEVEVLRLYVEGKSYQEIGARLGRHTKSIDNALQRIKRKLDTHLAEERDRDDERVLVA